MELKRPAQYYWTTLFDQYQSQSLSFAFVPSRSFPDNELPRTETVADALGGTQLPVGEVQPWQLPLLLASLLPYPHSIDGPQGVDRLVSDLAYGHPVSLVPYQVGFAQYVAHADVIPFEASPLEGKSLMSIAASAGVTIGMIAAGGTPLVMITVPAGLILCTAAAVAGPELGAALSRLIRRTL